MGAGVSQKTMNGHYYRRLKKLQHELESAGVVTVYKEYQLFAGDSAHDGFNVSFNTLCASNGETAGMMYVSIRHGDIRESYGKHWDAEKGISRIKELFGTKKSLDN